VFYCWYCYYGAYIASHRIVSADSCSVIICMDPIRVVVTAERLFFIIPDGADSLIELLNNQMKVCRPNE
jgi:hypothetical protein